MEKENKAAGLPRLKITGSLRLRAVACSTSGTFIRQRISKQAAPCPWWITRNHGTNFTAVGLS